MDQRNHDALEEALRLALGVPDNPEAAGLKSRGLIIIPLSDLMLIEGASALTNAWIEAQLGQVGWLSGGDADSAFCTSTSDPVVTGSVNWDVIARMTDVFLDANGISDAAGTADAGSLPAGLMSREGRLALERTLLAMAIDAVSGPGGLAAFPPLSQHESGA